MQFKKLLLASFALIFTSPIAASEVLSVNCQSNLSISQNGAFDQETNTYSWSTEEDRGTERISITAKLPPMDLDDFNKFETYTIVDDGSGLDNERTHSQIIVVDNRIEITQFSAPDVSYTLYFENTDTIEFKMISGYATNAGAKLWLEQGDCSLSEANTFTMPQPKPK